MRSVRYTYGAENNKTSRVEMQMRHMGVAGCIVDNIGRFRGGADGEGAVVRSMNMGSASITFIVLSDVLGRSPKALVVQSKCSLVVGILYCFVIRCQLILCISHPTSSYICQLPMHYGGLTSASSLPDVKDMCCGFFRR